jgi:hypothetical protein
MCCRERAVARIDRERATPQRRNHIRPLLFDLNFIPKGKLLSEKVSGVASTIQYKYQCTVRC